jgi:hypothetical protein
MKKGILILLAVVVLSGIAMYAQVARAEMPAICRGYVYYNSLPVDSAQVKLYTDRWCYLVTNYSVSIGAFGVSRVTTTPGYYRLCITKDSNKWQHVRFYFDGTNTTNVGNVTLTTGIHSVVLCPD